MSEVDYNRRPVQVVELSQPRCGLRFGVAPCTATGTPICYNTRQTCQDPDNYNATNASITWRFATPDSFVPDLYEESGQNIKTNAIPCLVSAQTQPTRLNIGAARSGESPFGVRSTITVRLQDIVWDDHVGDFYLSSRSNPNQSTFWAKWKARNQYVAGMFLTLYEGYQGQALGSMQKRLFVLERVDGPNSNGSVTLHGVDPLQLADRRRALFPRPTPIVLNGDINASTTTVSVFSSEADLTDAFGNTGSTRFLRFGDEIISYTGRTLVNPTLGQYSLTGVTRGVLGTTATSHANSDTGQRVGRYSEISFWRLAYDLIANHTRVGAAQFINLAQWDAEGNTFLSIFRATGTVTEPTDVSELLGEVCQQGLFSIWWDERNQTIPLLAIKPPQDVPTQINDRDNIMPGAVLKEQPNSRITRVLVYYARNNQIRALNDVGNYSRGQLRGNFEVEGPELGGEVRTQIIFSRWIREDALAISLASRLLLRYLDTPRYLTVTLDAKDRAVTVGGVVEVTTRAIVDTEGNQVPVLWQVISENEVRHGETVVYDLQTYSFVGRFAVYMADGSPVYSSATNAQKALGGWYADDDGLMGDGSDGYQYQ